MTRLGVLEGCSQALDLLFRCGAGRRGGRERDLELRFTLREPVCRSGRVGRPVRPGLLERRGSVADLTFECLARRRRLRDGQFERCPGFGLFECSLSPGFFERGGRGGQLPCQRVTLAGDLRKVRSSLRVSSGATFRIGGALRCVACLGVLGGCSQALDLLFRSGAGRRGGRECGLELRFTFRESACRCGRVGLPVRPGLLERRGSVADLTFECLARRRRLRHGLFERCPGVRRFDCPLSLGFFERGRRGAQLTCQLVTRIGDLRQARREFRVASGATLRIGGTLRCVARLGVLEGCSQAFDLLFRNGTGRRGRRERDVELRLALREPICRRDCVCCALLLGPLACRGCVAQPPSVSLALCARRLRHGLFERCPGVSLRPCSLFLGLFERGRPGAQLTCQRVTLVGDLRQARRDFRVASGATLRIGGALRFVARLGVLEGCSKAFDLLFRCGTGRRGRRERGVELRLPSSEVGGCGNPVGLAGLPSFLQRRPRNVQLMGERVARPRSMGEAGGEFSVTLCQTIDCRVGFRCTLLLGLAQFRFELQQPFLERQADLAGPCRCLMLSLALEACQDKLLLRLLGCRQFRLEDLPPRALVIERCQQTGLLTGIHPSGIGQKPSEIQRGYAARNSPCQPAR